LAFVSFFFFEKEKKGDGGDSHLPVGIFSHLFFFFLAFFLVCFCFIFWPRRRKATLIDDKKVLFFSSFVF
jgi:hypothetical protein